MIGWHAIWARLSRSDNPLMNYSSKRQYADLLSLRSGDHFRPRPITAEKLVSLIDLGWSDNRIACHFDVEPVKVSALRAYYGLVDHAKGSWLRRMRRRKRLENEDECHRLLRPTWRAAESGFRLSLPHYFLRDSFGDGPL